jgi:hypothetical protein
MSNQVLHIFPNVNLQNGHDGLRAYAKKSYKINVDDLQVGQFAIFINRAFTAVKVFAANNVLVHYKHPKKHMLNYKALKLIPEFFEGQDIGYTKALRQVIKEEYPHLFEGKGKMI